MKDMSNNFYELNIIQGYDHTYTLTDFVLRNQIEVTNNKFKSSHLIIRLASDNNVVIFQCQTFYILALPPILTEFQLQKLNELKPFFFTKEDSLCIMDLSEVEEKLVYQDYSSKYANEVYDDLIASKTKKQKRKELIFEKK